MPNEDRPVQDAPSGYSYSGNSLVKNSTPQTYTAPGASPVYSGAPAAAVYNGAPASSVYGSGTKTNSLVASSAPTISGSGATDTIVGSGTSHDFSPLNPSQQQALTATADSIGANPADLYAVINKETGGKFSPDTPGPGGEIGLIQFGKTEQKKYGVSPDQTFDEQLDAAAKYLKDRGWKPGMGLAHMYSIINAGSLRKDGEPRWNYRNRTGDIKSHVADIQANWYPKVTEDTLQDGVPRPRPETIEPLSPGIEQVWHTQGYIPSVIRANNPPVSNGLVDAMQQSAAAARAKADGLTGTRLISSPGQTLTGGVDKSSDILQSPGEAQPLITTPVVAETAATQLEKTLPAGEPTKPLQLGDKTDDLKPIQQVLQTHGYYKAPVDGDFGKHTRTAVRSFQRDQGLPDTGKLDADTAARITRLGSMETANITPPMRPNAVAADWSPVVKDQFGYENILDRSQSMIEARTRAYTPPSTEVAKPVYSAPPGSVPASDRVNAPPVAPTKLDHQQQIDEFNSMYKSLDKGAIYVDPNGVTRRKTTGKTSDASAETDPTNLVSAWNQQVDSLVSQGVIDPGQADEMYNRPPERWNSTPQGKGMVQSGWIPRDNEKTMYANGQRNISPDKKPYPNRFYAPGYKPAGAHYKLRA